MLIPGVQKFIIETPKITELIISTYPNFAINSFLEMKNGKLARNKKTLNIDKKNVCNILNKQIFSAPLGVIQFVTETVKIIT